MRHFHFILSAALSAVPLASWAARTCPELPPYANMTLTFNDEFKTPALDTTKWTAVAQGGAQAINNEQQAYVPGGVLMMPGGGVRLRAGNTPFETKPYTSGEITTRGHFAQTYGYFEMKAKFPDGKGLWPAFWMVPNDGSWPPEISIVEYIYSPWGKTGPSDPSYFFRNLFWPIGSTAWRPPEDSAFKSNMAVYLTNNYKNEAAFPPVHGDWGGNYHTYGVAWYPDMVAYYVDEKQHYCWVEGTDTKGSVPKHPMAMVANLAIGAVGGWSGTVDASTPFPADMDIAYIRAYRLPNTPATAAEPVSIMNPAISPATAHPGDTVTISTDIVTGGEVLPRPVVSNVTIFNYDATRKIDLLEFPGPTSYAANTTYHLKTRYTLPATLTPGIYTVYTCVAWNRDLSSKQCLASNQAPPITVVAP
jgi:beta-glucanase (GH16 family)